MKPETLHPEFFSFKPDRIVELTAVQPTHKGGLASLTPMMTIPMYTFQKEGSRKRKQMEKQYTIEKKQKYDEVKNIYD